MFHRAIENKIYLHAVNQYILIVPEIIGERMKKEKLPDNREQTICQLTLSELAQSDITDKVNMLTENIEDSDFYKIIGKFYENTCNIKNCLLDFEKRMGGGSTTVKVFENIVEERQRLCLCIVDSDQKFYNAFNEKIGETMGKMKEFIKNKPEDLWWKVLFLEVHEIENLIPIHWMEEVTKEIQGAEQGIAFLQYLSRLEEKHSPVFFFDIKKGIKADMFHCPDEENREKWKKYQKSDLFRAYWKTYIEGFGIDLDKIHEEPVVHGICHDILVRVNQNMNKLTDQYQIDEYLQNMWLTIGQVIFSWTCVGTKIN